MLVLIAIFLMLLVSLILWIVRWFRPDFPFEWVIASFTALISFVLVLVSRPEQSIRIWSLNWQPKTLFPVSPAFLLDDVSWTLVLSLAALVLAALLTSVMPQSVERRYTWNGLLMISSLGMLSVLAGDPLTLMLGWSAIDFIEVLILLGWVRRSEIRQRIVFVISARIIGTMLLVLAKIISIPTEELVSFTSVTPFCSLCLLIAAGLRLGVLPLHAPFLQDHPYRRDLGTLLRFVPCTASLMLLIRTAEFSIPMEAIPWLLSLSALAGVYGTLSWLLSSDELSGRPYWILGFSALCVAAAVRSQAQACLGWSLAGILSGGVIFLASHRGRFIIPVLALGLLGFSALPFTPAWAGLGIYSVWTSQPEPLGLFFDLIFLCIHLGLVLGALRRLTRRTEMPAVVQGWIWFSYIPGFLILLFVQFFAGWGLVPVNLGKWQSWQGAFAFVGAVILWGLIFCNPRMESIRRQVRVSSVRWIVALERILSLDWFYRAVDAVYQTLGGLVRWITVLLEGEGGILWAVVLLLLLLTLSQQIGMG